MKSGKQTLVAFYSLTGNTARVAQDIATRLDADLAKIVDQQNRRGLFGYLGAARDSMLKRPARIGDLEKNPGEYALTIVGTPIWAGKMTPAVRAYLQLTRGRVNEVAFFVTSGNTDIRKIAPSMEELAGRKAIVCTGFSGRDLKNAEVYEKKIRAFIETLQRAPRSSEVHVDAGRGLQH